ncbi:hypothetical protein [Halobacterium rubrum]|uniref:hypothetical protein n=1 Tax=Halobacterium TaxID=2239 RepID=UPI001F35EC36|nr:MULTISPECIES: hypothetical protein [Halobacterium]MDH5019069.1 hypothetical protein [Halobacterium rubrum]
MTIHFDVAPDDAGARTLRVRDTTEAERFDLHADRELSPEQASTDEFSRPVDAAVVLTVGELHFPLHNPAVFFQQGSAVHRSEDEASSEWLQRGTYEVDVLVPAVKTYVKVCDARVRARFGDGHTVLEVDPGTRLVVGARSHHEQPAGTVTTTEDPRDVMRAISTFGSALKTHSPDRSWPTLRGHPPALELGSSLEVPDAVAPPETGVTIEVPPDYGPIFSVAPLAYYLGATVEPGSRPRLHTEGTTHEFDPDALASEVADVLEHCFVLDGTVRTAGVYPYRHEQADVVDERTNLDHERLFELPLAERTAAYLDIPRSVTAELLRWHLTADVSPEARYAAALPHLVNALTAIRSPPPEPSRVERAPEPNALARSLAQDPDDATTFVRPQDAGTPGHAWVGEGFAVEAANPTVGSFRRGFEWPSGEGPLDVHVVYNDERLDAPDELAYSVHELADTSVRVSESLPTVELREALLEDTDFLHFVGHVTERGMVCPDGELDVRTLPMTGVGAFFLNGCRSYEQGFALLTAGAAGGIVTVDDVEDEVAGEVGYQAAMLLDAGFPLYAVLDVLDRTEVDTSRYTLLGDPALTLRRSANGVADLWTPVAGGDSNADEIQFSSTLYPTGENGLGSLYSFNHGSGPPSLGSARQTSFVLSNDDLAGFVENHVSPLLVDGRLQPANSFTVDDFQ